VKKLLKWLVISIGFDDEIPLMLILSMLSIFLVFPVISLYVSGSQSNE
jgi:hypothetical protein